MAQNPYCLIAQNPYCLIAQNTLTWVYLRLEQQREHFEWWMWKDSIQFGLHYHLEALCTHPFVMLSQRRTVSGTLVYFHMQTKQIHKHWQKVGVLIKYVSVGFFVLSF